MSAEAHVLIRIDTTQTPPAVVGVDIYSSGCIAAELAAIVVVMESYEREQASIAAARAWATPVNVSPLPEGGT